MATRLDGRPGIADGPRLCVRTVVATVVAVVMTQDVAAAAVFPRCELQTVVFDVKHM